MTSNRPYLLRAIYEWIVDNGLTPHILIDATVAGTRVPASAVRDGRIVLNIADRAVARLELGQDRVSFMARFSGVSQLVDVPMPAVLAIYAQENGQGMMFAAESRPSAAASPPEAAAADDPVPAPPAGPPSPPKRGGHLRVVK